MSEAKPPALLLTPVVPAPEGSGRNLRAWAWLVELSTRYSVHVIVVGAPEAEAAEGFPAASMRFVPVRPARETRWHRRLAKVLPLLVGREGFGTDWLQTLPGSDPVADLPDGLRPELVIVFRLSLHDVARPVFERFPDARTGLDLDDFESRTRLSIAGAHWRLGRWRAGLHEVALWAQYGVAEQLLTRRYDSLYVAAPEDRTALAAKTGAEVSVFPNRLSAPEPSVGHAPRRLLFVGSLDYPPNELAARWLMEMAPTLLARLPHLVPTIVGRRADDALRERLARCRGLDFFEDAVDLSPFYGSALAVLVPLQAGGGTKLKTIEAFAHARPVISTGEGVRGLGAVAGRHYLAAETTTEFIAAVEKLAADPQFAQRLGQAGQVLWRERFSL